MMAQRKRSKKWLWISVGVVVVIAVVVGVVMGVQRGGEQDNEKNNTNTSKEEQKTSDKEEQNEKATEEDTEEEPPKKVIQYTGDDPNESEALTGVITYAMVNDGVLTIRVDIDQYLTEGICDLILEQNSATIYNSRVDIWGDVSTSTCKGYDIPTSGLERGSTQIIINLTAGGKTGVIRGEVEI